MAVSILFLFLFQIRLMLLQTLLLHGACWQAQGHDVLGCCLLILYDNDQHHAIHRHLSNPMGLRSILLPLLRLLLPRHPPGLLDVRLRDHAAPHSQQRRRPWRGRPLDQ